MYLYAIIGMIFLATFLVAFSILYLVSRRRDPVRMRMQELAVQAGADRSGEYDMRASLLRKGVDMFGSGGQQLATTREWLAKAGHFNRSDIYNYYLIRIILAVVLAAAAFLAGQQFHWSSGRIIAATVAAAILGIMLPRFWVSHEIAKRREAIRRAVPNMLDLMVVCVEAGLSFTAALTKLSEELRGSCLPLAQELTLVNQEILIGKPKSEVFKSLANRTEVDELRSLAVTLIQADRLGTSIATSLRVLADTMRFKRRQRAEEAANRVTVKLVFPLVLLIFPELLIILAGPALISVFQTLSNTGH
jgi:tight adherence protein C